MRERRLTAALNCVEVQVELVSMTGSEGEADASTTVLVIGGGATGVGVARDLALRGVDVTLVDRGGLAGGTSGRSHGLLHSGARYAESDPSGARECIEERRILEEIAGACIRETGGLFLRLARDDPEYFQRKREACEAVGIEAEPLEIETVRRLVPGVTEDLAGAFRVPDAVVHPSRLVAATAADASDRGARIHTHAPVEECTVRAGRIERVRIGGVLDREIDPEFVVNAAGAWAGQVASMAGVDIGMAPTRGVMVSVACGGVSAVLNRCREPADGDIVVPHAEEVVLGTTSTPVDDPDDRACPRESIETCIQECAAMLPAVADAEIDRTWSGVRPLHAPDEAETDRRGISRDFVRIDHAADGVENVASIVGGKLTTHRRMAESAADLVCDRLGVTATCRTASEPLLGAGDPTRLDAYVERFDAQGPADSNASGSQASER
jgi:glycerol-3-phosphate dehydrogenase